MKKFLVLAIVAATVFLFYSCDEESEDPPAFDNGLMVTIGQNPANSGGLASSKEFTARNFVSCEYSVTTEGEKYLFSAKDDNGDLWTVKFLYDPVNDDSLVYMNESVNNSISLKSVEYGDYYIDSNSDEANHTVIKLKKIKPNEIIEADFEGFIYVTGSPAVPDTLRDGYFTTKKFITPR
ncbi:MAG TPA: hypothetical protein PLK90_04760 [Clostridiales bacterium]|nr:hypothetical protein [Clostridiales bacterium]HQP69693.1 hypothetical protein [Clostridiales bacterium]